MPGFRPRTERLGDGAGDDARHRAGHPATSGAWMRAQSGVAPARATGIDAGRLATLDYDARVFVGTLR